MNSFCTNVVKQAARFYYYYDFLFFLYFYCSFRLAPPPPPPPPKKKHFFTRSRLFCTFLCRCFARLRGETSQLHVLQRNCRMCSCSTFLLLLSFTSVAASISHFLTSDPFMKIFIFFFRQNMSPLLLSLDLPLSLLSIINLVQSQKKDST